jgi:predicted nicotinamide N-methyase
LRPDISLRLATELTPLWQATEDILAAHNLPPPFWAFAWPGAEALAAHIAADPDLVRGRRVLDFAAGCGLAGIAAAIAGAASVEAAEIDPFAAAAITLNAADNFQVIEVSLGDIVGAACRWDVSCAAMSATRRQ